MNVENEEASASERRIQERSLAFQAMRLVIHPNFATEHLDKGGDLLAIVFSPNSKFMLRKYDFASDVLYVADKKLHYYTHNPGRQCKILWSFIQQCGYKQVVFLGSSKGGTGALLWAALTSKLRPAVSKIFAIAFSPQVKLYPYNDNLTPLPSYVNNMKLVERNDTHRVNFQKYGDVTEAVKGAPFHALVIYGGRSTMDANEACKLHTFPNVVLRPIDVSFHGSVIPFVTELTSHDRIVALAEKLTKDAYVDQDLSATITQAKDEFIGELERIRCPSLNDLIDQTVQRFSGDRFI